MSDFGTPEATRSGAKRVFCFLFQHLQQNWLLVNSDEAITLPGVGLFTPDATVRCGAVEYSGEPSSGAIDVYLPEGHAITRLFLSQSPPSTLELTIYQAHRDQPDDAKRWWRGQLGVPEIANGETTFRGVTIIQQMQNPAPGMVISRQCGLVTCSSACGRLLADFTDQVTVSAVSGRNVTSAAFGGHVDGWYAGGMLMAPNQLPQHIVKHVGATITLRRAAIGVVPGTVVKVTAGDDQTWPTCVAKFGRGRFSGFPALPEKNPHTERVF